MQKILQNVRIIGSGCLKLTVIISDYLEPLLRLKIYIGAVIVFHFFLLYLVYVPVFHLHWLIPYLVVFLPVVIFLVYVFHKPKDKRLRQLTNCKYNLFFPFYFKCDADPRKSDHINLDKIAAVISPGIFY